MKFNLKKFIASTLVVFSVLPALAFAEDNNSARAENNQGKKIGDFCLRLSSVEAKYADQVKKTEEKRLKNESDRSDKLHNKESDADAKRASNRTDIDSKRMKNWDKMAGKAKTDAGKAAVEAYKTAIQNAVTTRRTAVDASIKAYRDGLAAAMATHSGVVNSAISTFKASVDAALAKAQTDCSNKVDSKIVKDTFNKSVSDAKKVLQDARKNSEMTSGLAALKKTRDDAIKAAETTFKQATDKARADLMQALKA